MIIFVALVVTGVPQRFPESGIAQFMIRTMGGIDITRWIHRIFGFTFATLAVWHLTRALYGVLFRRRTPYMIPTSKDFRDAIATLRYYLRLSEEYPKFDRYDFRQKFEYLGMLMGGLVMIATGFLLFAPVFFTKFLPAFLIPVAKTIHGYEAMLALSVILIWHTYGAHMNPDVFPFDSSIFTGKISRARMHHEHPLELERIEMAEDIKDEEIQA
jgi:formate dehydrogenase subunit gamma